MAAHYRFRAFSSQPQSWHSRSDLQARAQQAIRPQSKATAAEVAVPSRTAVVAWPPLPQLWRLCIRWGCIWKLALKAVRANVVLLLMLAADIDSIV